MAILNGTTNPSQYTKDGYNVMPTKKEYTIFSPCLISKLSKIRYMGTNMNIIKPAIVLEPVNPRIA